MLTFRKVANWIADLKFTHLEGSVGRRPPSIELCLRPSDTSIKLQRPSSKSRCHFSNVPVWLKISISALLLAEFLILVSSSSKPVLARLARGW